MTDFHLAELYGVATKALNQGVKRNLKRFPDDFIFQLSAKEWRTLKSELRVSNIESDNSDMRSQFVSTSHIENNLKIKEIDSMRSQIVTASDKRNVKNLPYAFTEQGIAMLSSVLKSDRAIDVNITIMRAFVILRQHITDYSELSKRINALEKQTNRKFKDVHEALDYLMGNKPTSEIGFRQTGRTQ